MHWKTDDDRLGVSELRSPVVMMDPENGGGGGREQHDDRWANLMGGRYGEGFRALPT